MTRERSQTRQVGIAALLFWAIMLFGIFTSALHQDIGILIMGSSLLVAVASLSSTLQSAFRRAVPTGE